LRKNAIHIGSVILFLCFGLVFFLHAQPVSSLSPRDQTPVSTQAEAMAFLEKTGELPPSRYWPSVAPVLFLENIRHNILEPLSIHEGNNTNFCSYAALSYLPLHFDPLGYAKNMLILYNKGKVQYGRAMLSPSTEIREAAGRLTFKGELDIRAADQMWFLTLADHFKGYLNFFDRHFDMGDENGFWAAANFAKFNRMIRVLFNFKVKAKGSDLIRIRTDDLYVYLKEKLKDGTVVLYVNNMALYQKDHRVIKPGIPTHFIVLHNISEADNGMINITYWDYGALSLQQVTRSFLERLVFGVAHCTLKTKKDNAG